MTETNKSERSKLKFLELVTEFFRFLESDFGFSLVRALETYVRYESASIYVNVYHGRVSYEVGFELGRLSLFTPVVYDLPVILEALAPDYKGQRVFAASEYAPLRFCVSTVAQLAHEHFGKAIADDKEALDAIDKAYHAACERANKMYTIDPVKQRALEAWRKRDYGKVVQLYASIRPELTEVEVKRLNYAAKKTPR